MLEKLRRLEGARVPSLEALGFKEPHAGHLKVLGGLARHNVLKCGRRFGKTDLLQRVVAEAARSGYPAGYFAPQYDQLELQYAEQCERMSRWKGVRIIKSLHRIETPTGGSIDYWSLKEEANRVRGRKYKVVALDECAVVDNLVVAWEESISPTLTDLGGDAWFASTPKLGSQFDELYWKGQDPGNDDWASWELPTSENPFITAEEIEFRRRNMSEAAFRREYLAKSEAEGSDLVHPTFGAVHIKEAVVSWEDCRWRVIGFDPGGGDPTGMAMVGVDRRGHVHQYGEFWRARNSGEVSLGVVVAEVAKWDKLGKLDAVVVDRTAKG